MAAIGAAISGQGDKFDAINILVTASTSTPPHAQDPSPKSSLASNRRVTVAGANDDANIPFVESVALKPPEVTFDVAMQQQHKAEPELAAAAGQPAPDDADDLIDWSKRVS
ncbi:hypothetical protein ZWY2020_004493 [Hordeum vulgare]|nr:hypothetical protein ZWY2020_004493 [Hordeum vulgare]